MDVFLCFSSLVGEHRVNHEQEQADLESSPWPMGGSMFIPSFMKPSCITKKPKNLVDVDYNWPENVSCKPSEANACGCWIIEIIEFKRTIFLWKSRCKSVKPWLLFDREISNNKKLPKVDPSAPRIMLWCKFYVHWSCEYGSGIWEKCRWVFESPGSAKAVCWSWPI